MIKNKLNRPLLNENEKLFYVCRRELNYKRPINDLSNYLLKFES